AAAGDHRAARNDGIESHAHAFRVGKNEFCWWVLVLPSAQGPGAVVQVEDRRHADRSEERRVGKECRSRWAAYDERKKYVSVTEKLMDELAQCYNVLPQLDINNTIDHRPEGHENWFLEKKKTVTQFCCKLTA